MLWQSNGGETPESWESCGEFPVSSPYNLTHQNIPMSLAAGVRLGPYEVLRLIGAGGMGEVYRARDTRLDRTVAIKILSEQFAGRRAFEGSPLTPRSLS